MKNEIIIYYKYRFTVNKNGMVTMRMQKNFTEKNRLEHKIDQLRNKMIQSAAATGLNSHRTIYYSRKLDKLIIIYQKYFYNIDTKERLINKNKII